MNAATASETLAAPLYVAWQITNECNLACLHCIEESGPGKAFRDELSREEALRIIDDLMDHEVPYLSLSGGEPMLHPHFFELVERVTSRGSQLKISRLATHIFTTPARSLNCCSMSQLASARKTIFTGVSGGSAFFSKRPYSRK